MTTLNQELIGPPKLTRFERARITGARALQIALGAPLLLKAPKNLTKPIDLANIELEAGILPITIRRKMPNGTYVDIPLKKLVKKEKK